MQRAKICLALCLISFIPALVSASSILGTAGDYNTFVFNDFSNNSDTEGRLAVAGDAYLDGYAVGLKNTAGGDSLIVGGSLNMWNGGNIYNGDARVGATGIVPNYDFTPQGQYYVGGSSPIDFAKEETYLKSLSTSLSQQTTNGTAEYKWGSNMFLTGDGTSKLQVFELSGFELLNSTVLWLDNVADDATILLNVSGDVAGLTNMGLAALKDFSDSVLFNFYEADVLKLAGVGVWGSVFAPFADINNSEGVINGTIIASSFSGTMQQNHNPFTGEIPGPTPVPEPGTFALFMLGLLGGCAVWRRRLSAD